MTRSQKEYIDDCFNHESNDPESQEWRETLTEEERAYVADKDERYRVGMLRLCEAIQAADQRRAHQQRDRTAVSRDPPAHPRGGLLP